LGYAFNFLADYSKNSLRSRFTKEVWKMVGVLMRSKRVSGSYLLPKAAGFGAKAVSV
jgi:hypothetical protein